MGGAGSGTGGYRIQTGVNGAITERGRDSRDIFVNYSDNGTIWSTPTRVNDDLARFHNWLPEVAVPCDGYPYVEWYDWRDETACGGSSHIYTSRSTNGGTTWDANQRVTTAMTAWTTTLSNIAPNQGDYNGMYGGDVVLYNWADGRLGDVDVNMAKLLITFGAGCPSDQVVDHGPVNLTFPVTNQSQLFSSTLDYQLASQRNWPLPAGGATTVAAQGVNNIPLTVTVPDTAANGINQLCFIVTQPNGAKADTCCVNLDVNNTLVGVPPSAFSLSLAQSRPNPVSSASSAAIGYSLPSGGSASLRVYGARGELVRTLVDGVLPAGPGFASWDLKDEAGRAVPSGLYYYRLDFAGKHLQKRLVVVK
jgi:hypothetical protein